MGGGDVTSEHHSGSPSVVADRGTTTLSAGPVDIGGGVEKRFTSYTRAVF